MKTEKARAAVQYAQALMELASEAGPQVEDIVLNDLKAVNTFIKQASVLASLLEHPSFPGAKKKELLVEIFKDKVHELTLRLLELLADKRRLGLLRQLEIEYSLLYKSHRNIISGSLTSARALPEIQLSLLKSVLGAKLGKHVELEVLVDESLIGGIKLRIGDEVMDGSVEGRLQALEKKLLTV